MYDYVGKHFCFVVGVLAYAISQSNQQKEGVWVPWLPFLLLLSELPVLSLATNQIKQSVISLELDESAFWQGLLVKHEPL